MAPPPTTGLVPPPGTQGTLRVPGVPTSTMQVYQVPAGYTAAARGAQLR